MNDPGLEEPIENDAADVENQNGEAQSGKDENDQAYLEPSRWWFASTAFPLIAGTFGPMGSAFSICALVVPWRVYIPPGGAAEQNGTHVADPKWLVSINAVQLVIALISNLFLLLNMAKRVRFSIAQPITIIGWYISSAVLIGLCACTSGPLLLYPRERYAFTGAFYYAIFSAALYFIVATLMLITVYGAYRGHYAKEFQLTMSQRTLMLQTISFLVYLLSGAAIFRKIEGWTYLDAVYWAEFTLLTIGIGDYAPMTHAGRSLLMPYAIGGIIILGLVIGSIRSLVLDRGKVKLGARMVEKERLRFIKKIDRSDETSISKAVEDGSKLPRAWKMKIADESHLERQEQEFNLMRRIQSGAATKRRWTALIISGTTWFALWFIGAAIFQRTERTQNWSYFSCLYFAYTSLLTIGYGDFRPQSNSGKAFFVFWTLLAVPSLTILISNMGDTIIKGIRDLTLWLGNVTVLPGEKNKKDVLGFLKGEASNGSGRSSLIHKKKTAEKDTKIQNGDDRPDSSHSTDQIKWPEKRKESSKKDLASHRRKAKQDIEKGNVQYHLLIVQELADVITHLNAKPAREYSYEEWSWYLKLAGEDDAEAALERNIDKREREDEQEEAKQGQQDEMVKQNGQKQENLEGPSKKEKEEWSWLGESSPLMGSKGETEWVLDKLMKRLQRELEMVVRTQGQQFDRGKSEGKKQEESTQ